MSGLEGNILLAATLTTIAGLSTGFGGLLAFALGAPSKMGRLGWMLSFSAGVMTYISFMDLLLSSVEEIGFGHTNLGFFVGIGVFQAVVWLVPEPDVTNLIPASLPAVSKDNSKPSVDNSGLRQRKQEKSSEPAVAEPDDKENRKSLMLVGLLTALGISLHNFPEGVGVYLSCLKGVAFGLPLAVVIAAHNIPEGMAVAAPVYSATGSKWQAVKWATLSGACEPVGALLFGVLLNKFITVYVVHFMLSAVSGIMVFMSICELIPTSLKYISTTQATHAFVIGMFTIFVSVYYLHQMAL